MFVCNKNTTVRGFGCTNIYMMQLKGVMDEFWITMSARCPLMAEYFCLRNLPANIWNS